METLMLKGNWRLSPKDKNINKVFASRPSVPCKIPGDIHSALLEQGIIPDPFYATNELDVQWVGKANWTLSRSFEVSKEQLLSLSATLSMKMVDTICSVFINDNEVGKCFNEFRRWDFEVKPFLAEGQNTIRLEFTSPETAAEEEAKELSYPIPYSVYPVSSKHRNLIRRTQCQSGWDWGPCINCFGIYDSIDIIFTNSGRILDYRTFTNVLPNGNWKVRILATYDSVCQQSILTSASVNGFTASASFALKKGINEVDFSFEVGKPKLWWPNGEGPQNLYALTLTMGDSTWVKKIGFRTLEVKHSNGQMTFCVNGRDLFAKGSNWIPLDAFPGRQTKTRTNTLLDDAVEANMNMLRVWGGGHYCHDFFYELCDQKGLLIWHDCMFSCSMYPSSEQFLENVRYEIDYQVKRIHDHACLALWCGNNEDLGAISWYEESRNNFPRYVVDYDRLNEGVVGKTIRSLAFDQMFWPSCPCAGPGDFSDNWHSDDKGDMHYWSVWHEGKDFEAYYDIKPRFVSEFGYQSFPELSTVETYCPESQLNITSPVMEHHQKNPRGNTIIVEHFTRSFRFPTSFQKTLYLSQCQQAQAIKTAVEYWRSLRPHCMGALYWQLNDNWPVASWSSIDYTGKWKLLHYAARRFFAPTVPLIYRKDGKVEIFIVNDSIHSYSNVEISVKLCYFSGQKISKMIFTQDIAPQSVTHICSQNLSSLPVNDAFIYVKMKAPSLYRENTLFLEEAKRCFMENPEIKLETSEVKGGFSVTVSCSKPAFGVALDAGVLSGFFTDNYFDIRPTAQKQVFFKTRVKCSLEEFNKSLSVMDLYSSSH